jgi:ATP-dependent DNA helicase RecQ
MRSGDGSRAAVLVLGHPLDAPSPPMSATTDTHDLEQVLRARFQLTSFRAWQREAIEALLGEPGRVLVVAPTGGGKSLTYQLPATVLSGVTLVISPLVALMEDQVRALAARGIPAAYLASTLDVDERRARIREAQEGRLKLLYCAPERLASDWFLEFLGSCDLSMVAIDEAHCISQWGHDFRPDYLRIGEVLRRLCPRRVLACTATATPRVRDEIRARLGLEGAHEVLRGFARENLHLEARTVDGPREARAAISAELTRALGHPKAPKGAAIVYCATRKATEQMSAELQKVGWNAAAYHAGLDADVRAEVNGRFASGALDVVAATNAFGMGIDRADVRAVVHAQPPASLEAYYQEVGRAGRDGDEAWGLLLCSAADVQLRRRLCELGSDGPAAPEAAARQWGLFRELLRYLDAHTCRHDFILRYFGDEREVLGGCGHCDVCRARGLEGELASEDDDAAPEELTAEAATEVRKALAGVARSRQRAGMVAVAEMLRGERNARIEKYGFDRLTTFGLLSERPQAWVLSLLRALLAAGWIDLTPTEHPVPFVTDIGWKVMIGSGPLRFRLPTDAPAQGRARRDRSSRAPREGGLPGADAPLFEALRARRMELARAKKVPPYVIAPDSTLAAIAQLRPNSEHELLEVQGMGPFRVEAYGEALLEVVRKHVPN